MINFSKLNIDFDTISKIIEIGNSCGVISCYLLSLIYNFKFDINEFKNVGNGLTHKDIQQYAKKNGVNSLYKELVNSSMFSFGDYYKLLDNNIVIDLAADNLNGNSNSPHTSLIQRFENGIIEPVFINRNEFIEDISKLKNLYITFYYKDVCIDKFVSY